MTLRRRRVIQDGVFSGAFLGGIQNQDTARAPHVLYLSLRLRGDKLNGSAAAVATNGAYCLPAWMEVVKILR